MRPARCRRSCAEGEQREHAALALVVRPHHDDDVFERDRDRERPEDEREHARARRARRASPQPAPPSRRHTAGSCRCRRRRCRRRRSTASGVTRRARSFMACDRGALSRLAARLRLPALRLGRLLLAVRFGLRLGFAFALPWPSPWLLRRALRRPEHRAAAFRRCRSGRRRSHRRWADRPSRGRSGSRS